MPRDKQTQGYWDQQISNAGTMAEQCMKLGAVILKPASRPPVGFGAPLKESDDE